MMSMRNMGWTAVSFFITAPMRVAQMSFLFLWLVQKALVADRKSIRSESRIFFKTPSASSLPIMRRGGWNRNLPTCMPCPVIELLRAMSMKACAQSSRSVYKDSSKVSIFPSLDRVGWWKGNREGSFLTKFFNVAFSFISSSLSVEYCSPWATPLACTPYPISLFLLLLLLQSASPSASPKKRRRETIHRNSPTP